MALATDFQNSLQDFINWLTLAEQSLNVAPPPSLILAAVLAQIDEHKVPEGSIPGMEGARVAPQLPCGFWWSHPAALTHGMPVAIGRCSPTR